MHAYCKRLRFVAVFLLLFCFFPALPTDAVGPWVSTQSYIVMDAETGQVLISQNADTVYDPASITKIMTLGLACQKAQGDWSVLLTISHEDVYSLYGTDSSHIALQEGEVVSLEDMLYATAMASANDAANALASYIGGDIEGGVAAMNAQVAALGLTNTTFSNPHGISADDHKTTAADMAVILQWALEQPGFETLFCNNEMYIMDPTNLQEETRYFSLQDWTRIGSSSYYVPEILGSKTGYTNSAGYTYATLAQSGDVQLICVMMKSETKYDRYDDVETLLDYAFEHFTRVTLDAPTDTPTVSVYGGASTIGNVQLSAESVSFLLYDGEGAQTITTTYEYDEAYILGTPYTATVTYTLPESSAQEGATITQTLTVSGIDALVSAYIGIALPTAADLLPSEHAGIFGTALLGCSLAALCVFLYVERPRKKRKQRLQNREK